MRLNINALNKMKVAGEKIAMLTAYDATLASVADAAGVDILLVGDSLGMVLQGHDSTLPVTVEHMVYHTQSVARGSQRAMILADTPFMSCRTLEKSQETAMHLMQAGANMVKIEGGDWLAESIEHMANGGIPVCVHLGLTPQSVHTLGGYKIQGKSESEATRILNTAKRLENSGAAMILLECVPKSLAQKITQAAKVPVIGIGAGQLVDGQVLVMHDALGTSRTGHFPKFVRNFMQGHDSLEKAFKAYVQAVKSSDFPSDRETF